MNLYTHKKGISYTMWVIIQWYPRYLWKGKYLLQDIQLNSAKGDYFRLLKNSSRIDLPTPVWQSDDSNKFLPFCNFLQI